MVSGNILYCDIPIGYIYINLYVCIYKYHILSGNILYCDIPIGYINIYVCIYKYGCICIFCKVIRISFLYVCRCEKM